MKKKYSNILFRLSFLLCFFASQQLSAQFYYGIRQEYGKNRVQFNDFDWIFLRFEAFDVYFYRGNEELAENVARLTHKNLPRIESYLDAPLDERVQILVFNNLSDLKQSNVNSNEEDDYNTGGVTRISGSRLFVYFDGDYQNLEKTLRMGLTEVVLSNFLYGSFTQSLANSALLNLPSWYIEGLISYMGDNWNSEVDIKVRDGFYSDQYKRINSLTQLDARYAGHSFWYFIAQTYGDKIIRNIVYMSVVNRDIESGFLYILGKELDEITEDWKAFYAERYAETQAIEVKRKSSMLRARKNHEITKIAASPNGRFISYVDRRFSQYKIYVYDRETDKKKKIYSGGYRIAQNTDYSYPLLAWHPNNNNLAIITEKEGGTKLSIFDIEKEELNTKPFYRFDKIVSLEYAPNGKQFLLSAAKNGQSDIYVYTILNTKIQAITSDAYDDLYPTFISGGNRIVWSSNRPVDTLFPRSDKIFSTDNLDLFATDNKELKNDTIAIWRLTNTPQINEVNSTELANGLVGFFSDRSSVNRQHAIKIDSTISYVDTTTHYDYFFSEYALGDNQFSLVDASFSKETGLSHSVYLQDGRYRIYENELALGELASKEALKVKSKDVRQEKEAKLLPQSEENEDITLDPLYYPGVSRSQLPVNILNYSFQGQSKPLKPKEEPKQETERKMLLPALSQESVIASADDDIEIPSVRNYFLSFFKDNFTVRFDNMFDNPQYQPFTGFVSGDLLNQGFNMNFKLGTMDLMHDYRIVAGVRTTFSPLPGTSLAPNAEFIFGVADYKNRIDKFYTYSRRSQVQFLALNDYRRFINNEFSYKVVYPFNPVASLHLSAGYRFDENIRLATDFNQIGESITYTDYAIARAAYIYDNTRKLGLNLYAGFRYKAFAEYYRNLTVSPSGLYTAGVDARHYMIIHRNFIWANRLAAGTSFGPEKLNYIMGGVDNDFTPNLDLSTPIARENNYIFQTLVTNMRGFFQNTRNGNTFAVVNSELRLPIISYFANRPIRNDFLQNLMVVGFADIGTAWNGPSPYAKENVINTITVPLGTGGQIVLDSQKEPIIVGTGIGLRSRLFGYYVRADWAWGIEDGIVMPNVFYISLSTDF